jgi:hypothetical protein
MLKPHSKLEEAIAARHVIKINDRKVSNQYWEWCSNHARPYVAICINTPKSRYTVVELDLYNLCAGGFDKEAGVKILRTILDQQLKPGSTFSVGPVYVYACVPTKSAEQLARYLFSTATEALSLDLITHEEWMKGDTDRAETGGYRKRAFAPISGYAYPEIIEALLKEDSAVFE